MYKLNHIDPIAFKRFIIEDFVVVILNVVK